MSTRQSAPIGVLLIAGFYIFGSAVLLISIFTNPQEVSRQIAASQGLPVNIGVPILPLTAALGLLISYGLISLAPWGFFLTLLYLIYIGSVGYFLSNRQGIQPYLGNFIWSFLVITYLLFKRRHFFKKKHIR